MRKIVMCKCGRRWFKDSVPYVEYVKLYGKEFPPEGFVYKINYYCHDCVPV